MDGTTSKVGVPLAQQSRRRLLLLVLPLVTLCILFYDPMYRDVGAFSPHPRSASTQRPVIPPLRLVEVNSVALNLSAPAAISCRPLSPPNISSRYEYLKTSAGKILVALNLHDSEQVIPSLARLILELVEFLGHERVAVGIFENGSMDKTEFLLGNLRGRLDELEVPNLIWTSTYSINWKRVDRIEQLAALRNILTSPLRSHFPNFPAPDEIETVLFLNDVFTCSTDALELLHQRVFQDASATCGLDWIRKKSKWPMKPRGGDVVFYDSWVTRSLAGSTLRPQLDFLRHWRDGVNALFLDAGEEKYKQRYDLGLPLPVYSCWNGMAAYDARPFRGESMSPLDEKRKPLLFRSGGEGIGECSASECTLIAKDFWRRGFKRFVLVPTVRATYESSIYTDPGLVSLAARQPHVSYNNNMRERIAWSETETPQRVQCWSWHRRFPWDFSFLVEWEKAM